MVHVTNKIVPIWVIRVNERCTIYIELQDGLKSPIDLFEVLGVPFYFDDLKLFLESRPGRCLAIPGSFLLLIGIERLQSRWRTALRSWHISLKGGNFLAWKLELVLGFTFQNLVELVTICDQDLWPK